MNERVEALVARLIELPDWLLYLVVGLAAAIENIVPPIPADVMIVLGAAVGGAGGARPELIFLSVWVGNVGSAMLVYAAGRRYGAGFFAGRFGRFLLAPAQVQALGAAYRRFGFPIIFFSRFLPVFRPIVPVFAGIARIGPFVTGIPLAFASAIWYGLLVFLGTLAGENWQSLLEGMQRLGAWLWLVAAVLLAPLGWWLLRTRSHMPDGGGDGKDGDDGAHA